MNENIRKLYEHYPILKKINEDNNNVINDNIVFKKLYTGELMTPSNEEGCSGIVFVVDGFVKIHRVNKDGGETNLFDLRNGEICHEAISCLLNFQSLNILGKAIQDTLICVIPQTVVKKYILSDNEFLKYMYKDLYKKFNTIIDDKEKKIHESVENRLIKYLISKNSRIIYGTHKEIAFEIDSGREVVSRKLKKIEQEGYIKLQRGKIILLKDLKKVYNCVK